MEDPQHTPDPITKGSSPVTWSIRGVDRDTRAVIEQAAARAGKTIGQYVNEDICRLVQNQLVQAPLPAASVALQQQIDHLTKLVEGMAARLPEPGKTSVWQRLFG